MARNTCVSGRVLGCLEPSVYRTIYEETQEKYHLPCTHEEEVQPSGVYEGNLSPGKAPNR
jgi:hypothetical protein